METLRLEVPGVRSLCWVGDSLVDWAGGGRVLHLDGSIDESRVYFAYRFDAAVATTDGEFAVIYERLGTKGLLLRRGKIVREIDRSFYQANVYEYPVALFRNNKGRAILAHCPDEYCRVELEDAETGDRIGGSRRKSPDFFHSRLRVSANGRWLLSAGWVWHPFSMVRVFDLQAAMKSAAALDEDVRLPEITGEVAAAEFMSGDELLVTTSDELLDEPRGETAITRNAVAVIDLSKRQITSQARTNEPMGTLMAVDPETAIGFFEHPKLVALRTGEIVMRWNGIASGKQASSIIMEEDSIPPLAIDVLRRRFAVADASGVHVVKVPHGLGR